MTRKSETRSVLKTEALLKERFKKKWLESNHGAMIELYKAKHKELESVANLLCRRLMLLLKEPLEEFLLECLVDSLGVASLVQDSPEVEHLMLKKLIMSK